MQWFWFMICNTSWHLKAFLEYGGHNRKECTSVWVIIRADKRLPNLKHPLSICARHTWIRLIAISHFHELNSPTGRGVYFSGKSELFPSTKHLPNLSSNSSPTSKMQLPPTQGHISVCDIFLWWFGGHHGVIFIYRCTVRYLFVYLLIYHFLLIFLSFFPHNLEFFPKVEKLFPSVWGE